ncbi:MAG: InlB B-repeat-containing protein [Clostridia bacterium]|nr:InlB B-repeat-containing protein [Clostridia bacterium]
MKRYISRVVALAITLIMLVNMLPLSVFATENTEETEAMILSVSSVSGTLGDTVQVTINLENNPGLASLKFDVVYDDVLTLTDVAFNSAFGSYITTPEPYTNPQTITLISPLNDISTNGVLATLTFEISGQAPDNHIAGINITYDEDDVYNGNYDNIALTVANGKVTVYHGVPGDVDGDSKVNTKDAILLFRYVAGWSVDVDPAALDCNGDNHIDTKDAITLFRYVAEWPDIVLHRGEICTHALSFIEAKAPTCTEDGNIAYWCCVACGRYFADENAANEISLADIIDPAKGHTEVVDKAVEPSCFETGLTEGSHCLVCNEVLVPQYGVPMIDHAPGTEATCTKDQSCTVCGVILKSANGHIAGVEASCTEPQRCTVCRVVLAEAIGHSLNYVAERDPVDANDPGNRAYWQCSVCKKCYLDETATQEIALVDTAWDTYLVYFFDLENDTHTIGAYKQSEVLSLKNIFPPDMKGYDFNGWHTSENFTDENKISLIPAGNTEKVDLYANRSLHEYKITLLGLGREESWSYNIANGIRLTTPKWKESAGGGDCLIFSHWTDEDGNKITEIPAGEIGDRTIEANWIYKENYAVSNKNKYTYVSGVMDQYGRYSFIYEIGAIKNIVLSKQHNYTFDGLTEHTEAETKTYTVGVSAGQEAAKTVSKIVSSSTEMANISTHTSTHTEGWEVGAKWKPEVEVEGIKVSAWEFSGGYSNSDTDTYENTGFSSEKNYEENGTENEVRSIIDYYMEESVSRTVSDTFVPGVTPAGNYTWARLMDVKVYAIVTYNPYTGNYVFDVYSVPTTIHNGLLYTLPTDLEYDISIISGDVLDFEIPFEQLPEMFYTVEYDANGGTGEMPKSVHELGVASALIPNAFEKEGYTFDGWKTTLNGDASIYTDNATICDIAVAGETVILYADWVVNSYDVTFNLDGGITDDPTNRTVEYDDVYGVLPLPYKTGHTFAGWYLDGQRIESDTIVSKASDHTLTARWTVNQYTVSYTVSTGAPINSEVYNYGAFTVAPVIPYKEAYAYINYEFYNDDTGEAIVFNFGDPMPAHNIRVSVLRENKKYTYDLGVFDKEIDASKEYHDLDAFDLSHFGNVLNSDYTLLFEVSLYMREEEDGIQEVYLSTAGNANIAGWEINRGSGRQTDWAWVYTSWFCRGNTCTSVMHLAYGAHGNGADDWHRLHAGVTVTVYPSVEIWQ